VNLVQAARRGYRCARNRCKPGRNGKRVKIYPLGSSPESTAYLDVYDKPFDATIPYDWRFFESLHCFVQVESWLTRDKVMIDLLRSIGIEQGKPFAPDVATKEILTKAAREAREFIEQEYESACERRAGDLAKYSRCLSAPVDRLADLGLQPRSAFTIY
jgi:hypothetical protein